MNASYRVADASAIYSPALLFYPDLIRRNIARIVETAGSLDRVRPHVKTHKTREIVGMQLEAGITKFKCATLAEAEMLGSCNAPDVMLAYPLVGPNCQRYAVLTAQFPKTRFSVLVDHPLGAKALSAAMQQTGRQAEVLIDLDVGQHRTGVAAGPAAAELYRLIASLPGLKPGGFHVYDGHNHQEALPDRQKAVEQLLAPVLELRAALEKDGLSVPRIVGGGTPTFPVWAKLDIPGLECSPGTCVLHDHGYGSKFSEMTFTPAALLLTRVISRPTPTRVTLDLGYKAVASDPPAGQRLILLDVPDYKAVLQNEEHLVIETPAAEQFPPGTEVYAVPTHICPTCAMHRQAYIIRDGQLAEHWDIVARDRALTI
ncbi:MAG: D-TA family PLP-dependent enzyme [Planctomycetia bacterium]|nr:D-TA family PLP-dependent enzyme [Planctomycetia bacterium]